MPVADIDKLFLEFVTLWRTVKVAGNKRDKTRDLIKLWFAKGGDPDHEVTVNETGSQSVDFEDELEIDGVTVVGIENVRKEVNEIDLDRVDAWIATLPPAQAAEVRKMLYKTVTTVEFQPDELYRLNQTGVLSDRVLDSLYETDIQWALTVKTV
jgi:hypothetical protein